MYLGVMVNTPGEITDTLAGPQRYRLRLLPVYLNEPLPNIALGFDDYTYPQVVIVRPDGTMTTATFRRMMAHMNFSYDYRLSHAPNTFSDEITFDAAVGDIPVDTLIFITYPRETEPYIVENDIAISPLSPLDALSVYRWLARYALRRWLARYDYFDQTTGKRFPPDWAAASGDGSDVHWLSLAIKTPPHWSIPPTYGIILHQDMPVGIAQWERPSGEIQDVLGYDSDARIFQLDVLIGEPLFQRRGIGTTTTRLIAGWLSQHHNAQTVIATPNLNNTTAIRCFERAGFVALGPQIIALEGEELCECLLMQWDQ